MILNVKKETVWKKAVLSPFGCLMDPRFVFSKSHSHCDEQGVRKERRVYQVLLKNSPLNVIRAKNLTLC